MLKRGRVFSGLGYTFLETLLTAGAFLAAVWARSKMHGVVREDFPVAAHMWLLPVVVAVWCPLLWIWGLHKAQRTDRPALEVWKVFKTVVIGTLVLAVVALVLLRRMDLSRAFLGIFVGADLAALALFRTFAVSIAHHQRKRGYDRLYAIVVGTGKAARRHVGELRAHPEWGIEVRGMLSEAPRLAIEEVAGVRVAGSLGDLPEVLKREVVDEVHFAVSRRTLERLDAAVRVCDETGVTVRIAMGLLGGLHSRLSLEHLSGTPLLTLSSAPRDDEAALFVKRAFDVASSFLALVLASPVLLMAALAVKLGSPGPVIFRQKRLGKNGRVFTLYKFRTMVRDAERLREGLAGSNEMDGPVFKMKDDPRVTGAGRWLRRLSVDELPQLWNVLRGDMSIVGPRPPIPSEVAKYERWQRRRLSMRPGITCLWQAGGRNAVDFRRWMEMDLEYIDNWSLALDLKIILRTIPAVLSSRGAS